MQKTIFLTALSLLALSACNDSDSSGEGRLSIGVKDAPVDSAEAVVIRFTGVELLGPDDESLRFPLDPAQAVDLLSLQGSNSRFLVSDAPVPVGVYEGIRLQADFPNASCQNLSTPLESYIRIDGTDYPLILPSGELKVNGAITVATGGLSSYVIDFDLRRSIAERGATGCYNLRPVLRVIDTAEIGTIRGSVSGSLLADSSCTADPVSGEGAAVYLYSGLDVPPDDVDNNPAEPLTSALLTPRNDGSNLFDYEIGFLLAGSYTAAFTCNAISDDPDTDDRSGSSSDTVLFSEGQNVSVTADSTSTVNFPLSP